MTTLDTGTLDSGTLDFPGVQLRRVRELPSLRHHIEAVAPSGRRYRWGQDELNPANVFSGLRWSSTMPGGYESKDAILPRKPGIDYGDLKRLSTLLVLGPGGEIYGEYRLERTPRVSGDRMSISPSAVGWQAHLEDDKSLRLVPVDRDAGSWGSMSQARRIALLTAGYGIDAEYTTKTDQGGLGFDGSSGSLIALNSVAELVYAMPSGLRVGRLMYRGTQQNTTGVEAATLYTDDDDDLNGAASNGLTLDDTVRSVALAPARYAMLHARASTNPSHTPAVGAPFSRTFKDVAVYDDSGIPTRAIDGEPDGVASSDVVEYAVRQCPLLRVTDESIQPSGFAIAHLPFRDATNAGEVVRQSNRFDLFDWAVWNYRVFWYHERGAKGKRWRARIGPAQLEETGPQVDRLWESIFVQYQDVDGSSRTVGPPSSGADTESALLKDADPENPANQLGFPRRDLLVMGTGTPRSAEQVGARFLYESRLLDTSGRAQHVGYIESDRGVMFPFSAIQAGDTVEYLDAADPSPRRVVKADHTGDSRTCGVDLDSPPEGLQALLERLNVVLVPLGIG